MEYSTETWTILKTERKILKILRNYADEEH